MVIVEMRLSSKYTKKQRKKIEHVLFAGFTHEPAVILAEKQANPFQKT